MKKPVSEETERLLLEVFEHFDKEDDSVRQRQIRQWRKLKYLWDGFTNVWYSEIAHDWRVWDREQDIQDQDHYDKSVNIFKALLESITAALSVNIPAIVCFPDDADNPLDIATAKAADQIAKLVGKHNNVSLLWLHALFILCTEGMIACYNYTHEDESYGTYNKDKYAKVEEEQQTALCPLCQANIPDYDLSNAESDEYNPNEDDVAVQGVLQNNGAICPSCMAVVHPEIKKEKVIVQRLVGITKEPKARQCLEAYGGLFVKVPNYAIKQKDASYIILSKEIHYAQAISEYDDCPALKEENGKTKIQPSMTGSGNAYEMWGRLSTQYYSEYPTNLVTVRKGWFRPCAFNILSDQKEVDHLKRLFPNGVRIDKVGDNFACAYNEAMDDHWTLTENPLADYIHHQPLGQGLVSVQEILTEMISLVIQTIEHGIPQTFVDPTVVNLNDYSKVAAIPGMIFPAKPASGKAMGDAFYEVKTAALSGEVQPFMEKVQQYGQMTSGALPSLFGGEQPNSSKTAAQYAMSRSQALQRLQTQWKMLTIWWKQIFGKVITAYIESVVEDEHVVNKDESGNFVNVFIRKSELQGKIGNIELEASDQIPSSWESQKDVIMQLLTNANPAISAALIEPENIPQLHQAIGIDSFDIPGEDDRTKQYEEIKLLVNSAPLPDPQTGQEMPSVDIEPDVDNNEVEADICRKWLVSDAGRLAKLEQSDGYRNVLLHLQRHRDVIQAMQKMNAEVKPPNINFSFKGEDLTDPQIRQEFSKVTGIQPPPPEIVQGMAATKQAQSKPQLVDKPKGLENAS